MRERVPHNICLVFDLDDTLYLERSYVESGFRHVENLLRDRFNVSKFFDTAWKLFLDGERGHIFDQALNSVGITPTAELVQELVREYREHSPQIVLLADALSCLEKLRSSCKLAMITDGRVASQSNKIRALGVEKRIAVRVLTGEWGPEYYKPHPRAFIEVQRQIHADPRECIYVGDNPAKDFISPRALGWKTVRIRRAGGLHAAVESGPCIPDYEFADLNPLAELVRTLSGVPQPILV